jgi:hypothetical protein
MDYCQVPPDEQDRARVSHLPVCISGRMNRSDSALIALIVTTIIGLVLQLACVNANLLLASAISGQREMGVRVALGASRGRIVRQLMTESLSLGIAGGVIGLLFTVCLVPLIAKVARIPGSIDFAPDFRVYLVLGIVSVVAGLRAGLAPARHGLRGSHRSRGKAEPCRLRHTRSNSNWESWRRRQDLNRRWKFCRPYRVVFRDAWLRLLVPDDARFSVVCARSCSEAAPKFVTRSALTPIGVPVGSRRLRNGSPWTGSRLVAPTVCELTSRESVEIRQLNR